MTSTQSIVDLVDALPVRLLPIPAGSKRATLKDWQNAATDDRHQLEFWTQTQPRANWGGIPKPGHFVLDIDVKKGKDGLAELAKLETEFGALPETLTATTPSGGQHRYFRCKPDYPLKKQVDAGGSKGLDIICDHAGSVGYVALPPSRTDQGAYTWQNWPDQTEAPHIAEAPQWLIHLAIGANPREVGKTRQKVRRMAAADLDEEELDHDPDLLQHLREALQHLDSGNYDLWIQAGQALKSLDEPEAKQLWLSWSATCEDFDPEEAEKKWTGFKAERTGYRSIFAKAQQAGWTNPGPRNKIAEFNQRHAVVIAGGSVCILREGTGERGGTSIDFMNVTAFSTLYANVHIKITRTNAEGEAQTKKAPLAKLWLTHPDRRTHEGVTFAPSGKAPAGYYNLWRGFAVDPLPGGIWQSARSCRKLLQHLRMNVCRGNRRHYRYLLAWFADMVQRPDTKPGVALVMRGNRGTGKSKVADILRHILGAHAFKASKSEHIVGRFSSHLADKLLLVAEESFFAGGKADHGTLKDLITSDSFTAEQKHIPAFEMRSCHRVMMLTNNTWAVPAAEDERRFFVLDVGEERKQDHAYFAAIDAEMFDGDGCRGFLRLLQLLNISKVNMRAVPQTEALQVQKQLSLEPHDAFILDALQGGELLERGWVESANPEDDPARTDVFDAYVEYCRALHCRPLAANRFGPLFEERTGATTYRESSGTRRRKYQLPPLDQARRRFEQALGIPEIE